MSDTKGMEMPAQQGRSARVTIGAVLAVVLLATGVVVTVLALRDGGSGGGAGPQSAASTSRWTSVCGQEARDFDIPGPDWQVDRRELSSGLQVAVTDDVGPCKAEDGVPYGYVYSPAGAVLATMNFSRLLTAGGENMPAVLERLLVPGSGADVLIKEVKSRPMESSEPARIRGFAVEEMTSDQVRVLVAVEFPQYPGRLVGLTLTAQWVDHDWKIEPMDTVSGWQMRPLQDLSTVTRLDLF